MADSPLAHVFPETYATGVTSTRERPKTPLLLAAAAWTCLVLVGPLVILASGGEPGASALSTLARPAFLAAALWTAARLGAWLAGSRLRGLSHLAWDGAAGLPVIVACFLVVGLVPGGFRPAVIAALSALLFGVALLRARRDPTTRFPADPVASSTLVTGTLLAALAALMLVWNRVPVLFFDTLAYHFAQPELWLALGRIAPEPWSLHSWFPPGASVLYGVGLGLGGESWARDANLLVALVGLLAGSDLARRFWGGGGAPLTVAAALCLPQIPFAIAIPAADLAHGTFVFVTLACFLLRDADGDTAWGRRASLACAGAVLTKYLGLLVPLALGCAWILLQSRSSLSLPARLRRSAGFALPAVLLLAPWLVADAVYVGNPVAPILADELPVDGLAPGGAEAFTRDARGGLPGLSDLRALGPRLFTGESHGLYPSPAWGWTPVLLLPLLVSGLRDDRRVRLLMAVAACLFVLWFVTYRWERFLVAVTLLIAVASAGAAIDAWRRGGFWRGWVVFAALGAAFALPQAVHGILRFNGGLAVAAGEEAPEHFLERSLPITRLYREAARTLPSDARVLLLGEMRHYRLGRLPRCAPTGFNVHPLMEALARDPSPAAVSRELRAAGFTHLLVDLGWVRRSAATYPSLSLVAERPELLMAYIRSLGPPLAGRGDAAYFELPR